MVCTFAAWASGNHWNWWTAASLIETAGTLSHAILPWILAIVRPCKRWSAVLLTTPTSGGIRKPPTNDGMTVKKLKQFSEAAIDNANTMLIKHVRPQLWRDMILEGSLRVIPKHILMESLRLRPWTRKRHRNLWLQAPDTTCIAIEKRQELEGQGGTAKIDNGMSGTISGIQIRPVVKHVIATCVRTIEYVQKHLDREMTRNASHMNCTIGCQIWCGAWICSACRRPYRTGWPWCALMTFDLPAWCQATETTGTSDTDVEVTLAIQLISHDAEEMMTEQCLTKLEPDNNGKVR